MKFDATGFAISLQTFYRGLTTAAAKNGLMSTVDGNGAGDEKKGRRNMKRTVVGFALAAMAANRRLSARFTE